MLRQTVSSTGGSNREGRIADGVTEQASKTASCAVELRSL